MRKVLLVIIALMINEAVLSSPYKLSDHYNGKTFSNMDGKNDLKSFFQVLKWKMTSDVVQWPEHVAIKNYPLRPLTPNEKVNATFINHATYLLQFPGVNVLTDPVYSERVSPYTFAGPKRVREPGIAFDMLPKIDVVVVSHNHYDHMDMETLKQLDAKFHPLFLVPLGDERHLGKAGIQNIQPMDWWEETRVKNVRFIFTPSQHWSARQLWDKNESLWGSFMIDSGAVKVYHAGDTGFGPHFKEIKTRIGAPDLALLPIGAYKPRWFMQSQHMDPEEAVKAHMELGADRTLAMHFGTFQLTDEGIDEPVRDLSISLQKMNIKPEKFMVLEEGQALSF